MAVAIYKSFADLDEEQKLFEEFAKAVRLMGEDVDLDDYADAQDITVDPDVKVDVADQKWKQMCDDKQNFENVLTVSAPVIATLFTTKVASRRSLEKRTGIDFKGLQGRLLLKIQDSASTVMTRQIAHAKAFLRPEFVISETAVQRISDVAAEGSQELSCLERYITEKEGSGLVSDVFHGVETFAQGLRSSISVVKAQLAGYFTAVKEPFVLHNYPYV